MTGPPVALSPKQTRSIVEALHPDRRICVWDGAVRSGKTLGSLLAWLEYVRTGPAGPLLIAGKTKDTVARNVMDPLQEWLGPLAGQAVEYTRGANTARILGRLVHIVGANDARSEQKIRGMTLAGAYVDEATLVPSAFWRMLLTRLSVTGAKLLATTNPDSPQHWLMREFLSRARELRLARWQFRLSDNPSLSREYVAALESEFTGLWYQRFIEGRWVAAEGAVYPMWDEQRHITRRLPDLTALHWVGVDDGTTHPMAAILLALGVDQRLYMVDELRITAQPGRPAATDVDKSARLAEWHRTWPQRALNLADAEPVLPAWTAVDPAAASLKAQLRRDSFPSIINADNRVVTGIRVISSLLSLDRLRVHDRCTGWIQETPGYVWQTGSDDKPVKEHDDSVDAGRYAVMAARTAWASWLTSSYTQPQEDTAA